MQEFLPVVKATLLEWAQLALGNPLFTASLILATLLLASIVGMIRSVPIKRRAAASEKARAELADQLSIAQQKAAGLQERLMQRNQQLFGTVQALAAGFDVGEQPLPSVSEDLAAEDLWQQHDRVVTQLANRLRSEQQAKAELQQSYQAEKDQRVEKEAAINSLQNALSEKTLQITGLEQQVTEILEKHTAQSVRLTELEQQRLEWDVTRKQWEQLEEKLATTEARLSLLQVQAEALRGAESIPTPSFPEPLAEAGPTQAEIHSEPVQRAAPIEPAIQQPYVEKTAFIRPPVSTAAEPAAMPPSPPVEEATGVQDQPQAIVLPDWDYQPEIAVPPQAEAQTVAGKEGGAGFAGKLKGLFGRSKPAPAEEEAQNYESPQTAVQSEVADESENAATSVPGQLGKIKSLLGLSKSKASATEAKPAESPTVEYVAPEPADAAEPSGSSARNQMKKIKNLFGMAKG